MTYAQQASQAPAAPPPPPPGELRDQIRQTIRDAQNAALDAQRAQMQAEAAEAQAQGGGRGPGRIITVGPGPGGPGGGFTIQDGRGRGGRGFDDGGIPPQLVDISMGFFVMCAVIVIGWPLARAFGKRLEPRTTAAVAPGMSDQLQRIEQAVEAMSIEVERISESQRYLARLQNERIPQGADRP